MRIQHNIPALNTFRQLGINNTGAAKALEKLSSGYKINRAGDDAAGLAISEKMRAQIRGLNMASKNSQDGISLIQTAEGGMQEINNMVQRIRELTVQAANDTYTSDDRDKILKEIKQLANEISETANKVEFNTKKVLDVSDAGFIFKGTINFQVGPNSGHMLNIASETLNLGSIRNDLYSIWDTPDTGSTIDKTISDISVLLGDVVTARAQLGAYQNRLEYNMRQLDNTSENLSAAESRIRDTDMAKEMMKLTKANIF